MTGRSHSPAGGRRSGSTRSRNARWNPPSRLNGCSSGSRRPCQSSHSSMPKNVTWSSGKRARLISRARIGYWPVGPRGRISETFSPRRRGSAISASTSWANRSCSSCRVSVRVNGTGEVAMSSSTGTASHWRKRSRSSGTSSLLRQRRATDRDLRGLAVRQRAPRHRGSHHIHRLSVNQPEPTRQWVRSLRGLVQRLGQHVFGDGSRDGGASAMPSGESLRWAA